MDITKAFTVDNGISLNDLVVVFEGTTTPEAMCNDNTVPIGSLYIKYAGSGDIDLYQKLSSTTYNKLSNIFGSQFYEASSDIQSQTTLATFQNKVSLSVNVTLPGTFRVGWTYSWSHGNSSGSFQGRVRVNNTTDIHNFVSRPINTAVTQLYSVSGFAYIKLDNKQLNTITLDYCSGTAGNTSSIRQARLEIWRVS
jgi:hypothetical protein